MSVNDKSSGPSSPASAPPVVSVGTPPVTTVKIVINGTSYKVPPGSHTVAYLKEVGGVPACDELSQVVSGKIVPLQDGGTVEIHGAETFLANPRSCPSS